MSGTVNMVLCGLGGQGILFVTKVLSQLAIEKGVKVIGAETHGMAQRGGSVVAHLRLGEVSSSLVRTGSAHVLLALEENEAYRNIPFLSKGARMYVNTESEPFPRDEVKPFLQKNDITLRRIPAGAIAHEHGVPMASNITLLGYFSAFEDGIVNSEELRNIIEKISPEAFREKNLLLFDAGHERGVQERSR